MKECAYGINVACLQYSKLSLNIISGDDSMITTSDAIFLVGLNLHFHRNIIIKSKRSTSKY